MKERRNTAYYSKIVSRDINIPEETVKKIMITCNKRILEILKNYDVCIDDIIIFRNIKYYINKK